MAQTRQKITEKVFSGLMRPGKSVTRNRNPQGRGQFRLRIQTKNKYIEINNKKKKKTENNPGIKNYQ